MDATWCNTIQHDATVQFLVRQKGNEILHDMPLPMILSCKPESFPCTFRSSDPDLAIVHMGGGPQKNFLPAMDMAKVGGPSVGSLGGTVCPLVL